MFGGKLKLTFGSGFYTRPKEVSRNLISLKTWIGDTNPSSNSSSDLREL